jgi:hypothetical protein
MATWLQNETCNTICILDSNPPGWHLPSMDGYGNGLEGKKQANRNRGVACPKTTEDVEFQANASVFLIS